MELASDEGRLQNDYIHFLELMDISGLKTVLFDEEYTYHLLFECFSANEKINEYLVWAVRMSKSPVSTVTETLKDEERLSQEVLMGKNLRQSDIYTRFFQTVRARKEHSDNLGEELIAICIHILSHLPSISEGKLCVVTDDKGAAGKIDFLMKKTNLQYRGTKIILFSTPKLVQYMYKDNIGLTEDQITKILSIGHCGNIVVMGTTAYDLAVDPDISMSSRELAKMIMKTNGINIVF